MDKDKDKWLNSEPPCPARVLYSKAIPKTWVGVKPPEAGLVNTGVSCFVNATIQALMHVPGFVDFLKEDTLHRAACFSDLAYCVTCAVYRTYLNMTLHATFKPLGLLHILSRIEPSFNYNRQQDAQEFMIKLSHLLEEEFLLRFNDTKLDYCSKQTTAIGQIFGWWMITKDLCNDCGRITKRYGPVTFLSVPVNYSIQSALDDYFNKAEVVEKNCSKECLKQECSRKFEMHSFPNMLRIMLNRFDNIGEKISTPVNLDRELRVKDALYTLSSCVLHEGLTATVGHYTCIAVANNGKVKFFNDAEVSDGSEKLQSFETKCNAYLLFYQLHHVQTPPEKRRHPTPVNSPPHKKKTGSPKSFEKTKRLLLSPHKFKKKLGGLLHAIIPCQSKGEADVLAEPTGGVENRRKVVTVVNKNARKQLFSDPEKPPVSTLKNVILHDHNYLSPKGLPSKMEPQCSNLIKFGVTKTTNQSRSILKINQKGNEKGTLQSSSPSVLQSKTKFVNEFLPLPPLATTKSMKIQQSSTLPNPPVETTTLRPLKIRRKPRAEPKETDSQSENEYKISFGSIPDRQLQCRTTQPMPSPCPVSPIKIKWQRRAGPKETESQSDNEYRISSGSLPDRQSQERKIKPLVLPPPINSIKIKRKPRQGPKETESQSENEYRISLGPAFSDSASLKSPSGPNLCATDVSVLHTNEQVQNTVSRQSQNSETHAFSSYAALDAPPKHPFVPVKLTAADVPGANLPYPDDIQKNSKAQLQRWLKCRNIPIGGTKDILITKVKNKLAMPTEDVMDPKVDGGIHYEEVEKRLLLSQDVSCLNEEDIFPEDGWDIFPSRDMPGNFNFGSIYHYLVETMPVLNDMMDSSDINSSDEADEPEKKIVVIEFGDPFEDTEGKEILSCKKLRRGLQFLKSGFIRNIKDNLPNRLHLYKADVRASLIERAYTAKVAISQVSGSIIKGVCLCPQRRLGRCSHVSALLLHLLIHRRLNGPAAISCTSKPCTWNKGSLQHNPSVANQRQYDSFKMDVIRRANFDPRPQEFQQGPNTFQINQFVTDLQKKNGSTLFESILPLTYEDFEYDDEDLEIFMENRDQMYAALLNQIEKYKPSPQYTGAFEIKATKHQSSSILWHRIRSLNCSAQPSRQIGHFTTEEAKKNFLRKHLWGIGKFQSKEMKFGTKNEPVARAAYAAKLKKIDCNAVVEECGLFLHTEYIGLSCSPDGIVRSTAPMNPPQKLLEIKTVPSQPLMDPEKFDNFLPQDKLNSFYLTRDKNGSIKLKDNHSHYDQVQVTMGMLNIATCDFFVWTETNSTIVAVPFDVTRWEELKRSLKDFHWKYLIPEYFAMRCPRDLNPIELP